MKNIIISVVSIVFIVIYSVFSMLFLDSFNSTVRQIINNADKNGYNDKNISELEDYFNKTNSILIITSNKDHIDTVEQCIINIRYSSEYNDIQNLQINKDILLKTVENMNYANKSPL